MLSGDNGILQRTTTAKQNTERAEIVENARLDILAKLSEKKGENLTENELEEILISPYYKTQGSLSSEENILERTLTSKDGKYTIPVSEIYSGNFIDDITQIERDFEVGDYVNYTPAPTQSSYTFNSSYTGYDSDITVSAENEDDGLHWRVLNINDDTVDLISSRPLTTTGVFFKGAQGYNNGVYLLNEICNKLYSNASLEATARSINIEDIQGHLIDKNLYMNQEKDQLNAFGGKSGKIKYGDTFEYTSTIEYPIRWKSDNGTGGESLSGNNLITDTTTEQKSGISVKQTFWTAERSTMQLAFNNNIYYELFFYPSSNPAYWVASRSVHCDKSRANFGLRYVSNGETDVISAYILFDSLTNTNAYGRSIVPIVSLSTNAIHKIETP